jgi:hypothetical protein
MVTSVRAYGREKCGSVKWRREKVSGVSIEQKAEREKQRAGQSQITNRQ